MTSSVPFQPPPLNRALPRWVGRTLLAGMIALAFLSVCAATSPAADDESAPFSIGEKLGYDVTLSNGSRVGRASMWIEGPVNLRGSSALVLRFDSRIRFMLLPAVSQSSSWFDPVRGASLRFLKHERNPLTHDDESVDVYPDEKRWRSAEGDSGVSLSKSPLDELSFMYFIRTLPMTPGSAYSFDRHFDAARNPISVSVIRREVIPTPMGELHVVRLEMRVRDPRHYGGEGAIVIHLSDDDCRLPVRIQSTMPVVGTVIMTINSEQSRCKPR